MLAGGVIECVVADLCSGNLGDCGAGAEKQGQHDDCAAVRYKGPGSGQRESSEELKFQQTIRSETEPLAQGRPGVAQNYSAVVDAGQLRKNLHTRESVRA